VISSAAVVGTKDDYNTVETAATSAFYSWAGQSYASLPEYQAASGQGAHDSFLSFAPGAKLNQIDGPLIDAADANAPHELSSDMFGRARVDDSMVGDSGTSPGYYDRGAVEFQDPYTITPTFAFSQIPTGATDTVGVTATNPWSTPITSYTFSFDDGTASVVSAHGTTPHVFSTVGRHQVTVTATSASGTVFTGSGWVEVTSPAPLVPELSLTHISGSAVEVLDGSSDSWQIVSRTVDFGDGSAPLGYSDTAFPTHTYVRPGVYEVTLTVKDAAGHTASTTTSFVAGSGMVATAPTRIVDTRSGLGVHRGKVGPHGVVRHQVTGIDGFRARESRRSC
jgi:PKD repeat protein